MQIQVYSDIHTGIHREADIRTIHTMPYHTTSDHTIPYATIPYQTIPSHTIPHHTIPDQRKPYITDLHTITSQAGRRSDIQRDIQTERYRRTYRHGQPYIFTIHRHAYGQTNMQTHTHIHGQTSRHTIPNQDIHTIMIKLDAYIKTSLHTCILAHTRPYHTIPDHTRP